MNEDEEALLAELRAISNRSGSSRFVDNDNNNNDVIKDDKEKENTTEHNGVVLEKKKMDAPAKRPQQDDATLPSTPRELPEPTKEEFFTPNQQPQSDKVVLGGSGNFKQESTFSGERGGAAEDEDLLALLKGISAKSGGADRFADDGNATTPAEEEEPVVVEAPAPAPKPKPTNRRTTSRDAGVLPPWKRGKAKAKSGGDDVVVVAAKPPPKAMEVDVKAEEPVSKEAVSGNFKQESTFSGERGGAAEDEELLALLRGVSAKSSGADRFGDDNESSTPNEPVVQPPAPAPKPTKPRSRFGGMTPWKRGKAKADKTEQASEDVVVAAAPPPAEAQDVGGFQKSNLPNTFKGDRGGAAEDEELLALLKGVSSNSSSSRFGEESGPPQAISAVDPVPATANGEFQKPDLPKTFKGDRGGAAEDEELLALLKAAGPSSSPEKAPISSAGAPLSSPPPMSPTSGPPTEIVVTREQLPVTLTDKDWKVRKASYVLLRKIILESSAGEEPRGEIDGESIIPGLDNLVPTMIMDKNANALEGALQVALEFADYCQGGGSADLAEKITVALIKGNGFTSPRPTAVKVSSALAIKLMEVGNDTESLNTVIGVLLDQGITSRKPKVVQTASTLILEAAHSFGAACLPLAAVNQALPNILTHSNKKVRDTGMEVVAEFCRALGSKVPMNGVLEKMKPAQVKELDVLLAKEADPAPVKVGLRSRKKSGGDAVVAPEDALAALQAGAAELEAERFMKRPAAPLLQNMKKTEYAAKLKLAKWSEKVAGLNMILESGGEKPYKLVQPDSTVNYAPLISEMKGILSHTHFAVVGKALEVLSMLAQGVGERLYPNLRPLLPTLLILSKDKKLTRGVSACLDSFFGNVLSFESILDEDGAIPHAADERKERNALARTSALNFLGRCVTRGDSAGVRGKLSPSSARKCAEFCALKLGDSDANVRKAALDVLKSIQQVDNKECQRSVAAIVEELKSSNPRAYKSLSGGAKVAGQKKTPNALPAKKKPERTGNANTERPKPSKATVSTPTVAKKTTAPATAAKEKSLNPFIAIDADSSDAPSLEEAASRCSSFGIPSWEAADEDGGILSGLESPKWLYRQNAIKAMAEFVKSREITNAVETELDSSSMLVLVKEHTRGFKETNVNVTKSIMELFIALCELHEKAQYPFPKWASKDGAKLATEKIADKKLSNFSRSMLISLCVVQAPHVVLAAAFSALQKIRAPAAHEEYLMWFNEFLNEFGAASIGTGMNGTVSSLQEECNSKNMKARKAALVAMGSLHEQLGPAFQAIAFAAAGKDQSLRDQLEKCFSEHTFDPSTSSVEWQKKSICCINSGQAGEGATSGLKLEVPKLDLFSELPADCIEKMGSKDSKTAWKARKAAMEDVDNALKRCSGLLDTTRLKRLVELLRALKERLSDSQSNLKPVAARLIGSILGSVDAVTQGKLGKVVYGPIINAAMNDKKKNMHDAAMEALRVGTSLAPLEGEGPNRHALEAYMQCLVVELSESEFKAGGIAEVLVLTQDFTAVLPDLDSIGGQRGESLGYRLCSVMVEGLTSSKSDIRSAMESLLNDCVKNKVVSISTVKKSASRLKPAMQRSLGPILAKLSSKNVEKDESRTAESQPTESMVKRPSRSAAPQKQQRNPLTQPRSPSNKVSEAVQSGPEKHQAESSTSANPLVANVGPPGLNKSRAALRSMTWPEYPEEPLGPSLYNGLKKAWVPLIPPESAKKLFPDGGIRKQDDAMEGCELLSRAIVVERSGDDCAILEQFVLILKWTVYVLCSKESTVGLQALLSFFSALFEFLKETKYELSDSEAMALVPWLFDKASVAKGRFKDIFMDLVEQIKSDDFLPPKRMGPLVCVALMEASSHPKARLMACKECYECVESIGLSGIGKKGVLAAAKALSEEKLQENRTAFLDLMELLLKRMNGDMQRFSRICGSSLSGKARSLVEERFKKSEKDGSSIPSRPGINSPSPARPSRPTTRRPGSSSKSTPSKLPDVSGKGSSLLYDELPALDLRAGVRRPGSVDSDSVVSASPQKSISNSVASPNQEESSSVVGASPSSVGLKAQGPDVSERFSTATNLYTTSTAFQSSGSSIDAGPSINESIGAAASLRARLMKIRERNKNSSGAAAVDEIAAMNKSSGVQVAKEIKESKSLSSMNGSQQFEASETLDELLADDLAPAKANAIEPPTSTGHLDKFLENLRVLLAKATPLEEEDVNLLESTSVLKTVHAAVSRQPALAVGFDPSSVTILRSEIGSRANEVVATLTRLISFGFNCHNSDLNAGMSVPLLSVTLACLMAIFRSDDLPKQVQVEDLTILVKDAGKALLDPRLASSATTASSLDEETSTQMVRAINKLAVQAATGSIRHVSLQALIALQQQISLDSVPSEDTTFNSRLSRIVSKLFSRVLKAEEASLQPFSAADFDTEAIVCCLEDSLVACNNAENGADSQNLNLTAVRNLAKTLVAGILKARGETSSFRSQMAELEIDPSSSLLGKLVASSAEELGITSSTPTHDVTKDVASLVSAVGSAPQGSERDAAIDALKQYKQLHGDEELNNHLSEISGAFRAFILNQLSESIPEENSKAVNASSMSERIKNLRSKLNATEAVVQSAVVKVDDSHSFHDKNSGVRPPSPPKISTVASSSAGASSESASASVRAFRARLAAAQDRRVEVSSSAPSDDAPEPTDTAMSRAAALRARLQAVKGTLKD